MFLTGHPKKIIVVLLDFVYKPSAVSVTNPQRRTQLPNLVVFLQHWGILRAFAKTLSPTIIIKKRGGHSPMSQARNNQSPLDMIPESISSVYFYVAM